MSTNDLALLVAPPIVGAVIGLVTNWLAIKMLFRPLAEKRILGLRLPFTPGLLPRERGRLAQSLGKTVSEDLLDPESVGERLRSQAFKGALRKAVESAGAGLLVARPTEAPLSLDPSTLEALRGTARKAVEGIAGSEPFALAVAGAAVDAIKTAREIGLGELLGPAAERLLSALAKPDGKAAAALAEAVVGLVEAAAGSGASVASLIGEERLAMAVSGAFESAYAGVPKAAKSALSDPEVRAALEKTGAKVMRRAIDRMSAVQRFFIGLGQYDKAILDSMPATIEDVAEAIGSTMESQAVKRSIKAGVLKAAMEAASEPLATWKLVSDPDKRAEAARAIAGALAAWAGSAVGSARGLAGSVSGGAALDSLLEALENDGASVGVALAAWLKGVALEPGSTAVGRVGSAFVGTFARAFVEGAKGRAFGSIVGLGPEDVSAIAAPAADALSALAAAESARALKTLDVRSMVIDKIDSLDMIEVERMLLRIIDKELGAITALGGVLGGLIGLAQSLLSLLRG